MAESDIGRTRILILEDEQIIAFDLRLALEARGHEIVATASSADEAIDRLQKSAADLLIVDYKLDGPLNGEEAVSAIRSYLGMPVPVIFISGDTHSEFVNRMKSDPCAVLVKPFELEDLLECIEDLLKNPATEP